MKFDLELPTLLYLQKSCDKSFNCQSTELLTNTKIEEKEERKGRNAPPQIT